METLFDKTLDLVYEVGNFSFTYTAPWGNKSKVKVVNRGIINLEFPDAEEDLLLEDCDTHLLRAVYNAAAKRKARKKP